MGGQPLASSVLCPSSADLKGEPLRWGSRAVQTDDKPAHPPSLPPRHHTVLMEITEVERS